jgi:hypothetical protein
MAQADVSPERLLPYDSAPIQRLKIGGFSSVTEPTWWGPGFPFLDVWTECHYVASRQVIVLKIGRPAGEPKKSSFLFPWLFSSYDIPIKFVWVEVALQLRA